MRGREKVITEAYSESRNVQVFDIVRKKAYTLIREYWGGRYEDWERACLELVQNAWSVISTYNSKSAPYLMSEMKATARSIAGYTWKKTTPTGFQTYVEMTHLTHKQKARQAKSVESRLIKSQDKREQAIELRKSGMKTREIGQLLDVSAMTISRWTQ
jgi:hypothetical protein